MKTIHKCRYFIVFYLGLIRNGETTGHINFITWDNRYINSKDTIDFLKKKHSFTHVVITNIIELSKQDYEDWCSEEN